MRLEVGSARVTPHVARDLTSWIHEKLVATNVLAEFGDNRANVLELLTACCVAQLDGSACPSLFERPRAAA